VPVAWIIGVGSVFVENRTDTNNPYVLHQRGDKNREFYLTICLTDIPSSHH